MVRGFDKGSCNACVVLNPFGGTYAPCGDVYMVVCLLLCVALLQYLRVMIYAWGVGEIIR